MLLRGHYAHSPRSFIDVDLFETWFDRFIDAIPAARPVLLLLDGHCSHLTLTTLRKARANQIHMLCFPPHTTHIYQPLDKSVFGPLKAAFRAEVQKLMRKNKKKSLNRYDFNRVLKPAWYKAVTPGNITAGFRSCGVWPFNPEVVKLPCEMNIVNPSTTFNSLVSTDIMASSPASNETFTVSKIPEIAPGLSSLTTAAFPSDALNAVVQTVPPEIPCYPLQDVGNTLISPVIKVLKEFLSPEETPTTRSRRVTKSRLITSDAFIQELEEKETQKKEKLTQKGKKKKQLEDKNNDKENSQKRKKNLKKRNPKKKATEIE